MKELDGPLKGTDDRRGLESSPAILSASLPSHGLSRTSQDRWGGPLHIPPLQAWFTSASNSSQWKDRSLANGQIQAGRDFLEGPWLLNIPAQALLIATPYFPGSP